MKDKRNLRFTTITGMILIAALTRFIPHPPNFTPLLAIALFGGAAFSDKKYAFFVPIAAMLLSDLFLSFHSTMIAVYLCFIATVFIGFALRQKKSVARIGTASLLASLMFYIVTNFGVWMAYPMYPKNLAGLMLSYEMAIPFFSNTILSGLIYSTVLFGGLALAENLNPKIKLQAIKA